VVGPGAQPGPMVCGALAIENELTYIK